MEEDTQDSSELEVAPQGESNDSTQSEPSQEIKAYQDREAEKERDWRAMRQRQKEMEYALKQKDEILEKLLSNQKQREQAPIVDEEEPDDDFVPAGKVKGIARRTVQPLEKKIEDLQAKIEKQEQDKLIGNFKMQFPDFNDVVNIETLEILETKEPELAATISQLKNPYTMCLQTYKYIKAFGFADEVQNARRVKEIDKKIEKNSKSVQSPQAFDKRPMAQTFKSTAADKKRLYEEMMFYAGQASGL